MTSSATPSRSSSSECETDFDGSLLHHPITQAKSKGTGAIGVEEDYRPHLRRRLTNGDREDNPNNDVVGGPACYVVPLCPTAIRDPARSP